MWLRLNNGELDQGLGECRRNNIHNDVWYPAKGEGSLMKVIAISKVNECLFGFLLLPSFLDPHNYRKGLWNSHLSVGMLIKKNILGWLLAFFISNYWNGKRIKEALFFFWKNLVYLQYLKKRLKRQTVFKFLGKFYF